MENNFEHAANDLESSQPCKSLFCNFMSQVIIYILEK